MVNFVCKCTELGGVTCYCFLSIVHVLFHYCMSSLTWWLIITLLRTLYFVSSMLCILAFFWFGFSCEFFATIFLCWWIPPVITSCLVLWVKLLYLLKFWTVGAEGRGEDFQWLNCFVSWVLEKMSVLLEFHNCQCPWEIFPLNDFSKEETQHPTQM